MASTPNLFLVGAAKSATTSLYRQLAQHPDVFMSANKEPHYLCSEHLPRHFTGPGDEGFEKNMVRSSSEYEALFASATTHRIVGEGSVFYLHFPDTAEKIARLSPDPKVLVILRNPVDRAFSAYMHTTRDGREHLSFEEALDQENTRKQHGYQPLWWYRTLGYYAAPLQHYLKVLGSERVKVFLYEDLHRRDAVMREVFRFLDVEPMPLEASPSENVSGRPPSRLLYDFFAKPNAARRILRRFAPARARAWARASAMERTLRRSAMCAETRRALATDYGEDIQHLESLLGRSLAPWLASDVPAG